MLDSATIRDEQPGDPDAIRTVNELAFGRDDEARLVDTLRSKAAVTLSLVAVADRQIVGHILYSPVTLDAGSVTIVGAGLAPMSVLPEFQRRGIGSTLVAAGNGHLRAAGCPFIVVLGHPGYYPRFGFEPASRYAIRCQWDVPDDAFMLLVNERDRLPDRGGLARYRDEFLEPG
jgi:putative acetyltransferase